MPSPAPRLDRARPGTGASAVSGQLVPAPTLPVTRAPRTAPPETGRCDLVIVGGVPGAGKSTAIARATDDLDHVRAVDPEHVTWWLRHRLPAGARYRSYRWVVHLVHTLRVLICLLDGPTAGRRLVVHDPGTRLRRRSLFARLARLAGWRLVNVYVDVDREVACEGQVRRGRVVRSFEEHWQSWQALRPDLVARADPGAAPGALVPVTPSADPILLVDRADAATALRRLLTD